MGDILRPPYYCADDEEVDLYEFTRIHNLNPMQADVIKRVMRFGKKGGAKAAAIDAQQIDYIVSRMLKDVSLGAAES